MKSEHCHDRLLTSRFPVIRRHGTEEYPNTQNLDSFVGNLAATAQADLLLSLGSKAVHALRTC
jgi:hypothetical protein